MKITILNGNPSSSAFDAYLEQVQNELEQKRDQVTTILIRDLKIKYCTGCWGCWVKTPGLCQVDDASIEMDKAVINSDFVLWAAPLKMGFPAEQLKMAMDKHLPLIHPYMVVDQGEAHHLKRYEKYPRLGLLIEKEASTDENDLQLVTAMFTRTALNFKTRLQFSLTNDVAATEVVRQIRDVYAKPLPLPKAPRPTIGSVIPAPGSLTLLNGSPRGPHGNSPIFLEQLAQGFGGKSTMLNLVNVNATVEHVKAFREAECAILAFPLYTDSMPGIVKHFIEALEPFVGQTDNPPLGFIVQSGFPEGLHSRYIERYLEKLTSRLGSPYIGTIVKGNGEGVRIMPENMNRSLFDALQTLGKGLAKGEPFSTDVLKAIAKPERFPSILGPIFKIFLRLPLAHAYFDGMLKKNAVYEKRFNQPFVKEIR